jgi:exo-1,4-beta-D-glucosaminidase
VQYRYDDRAVLVVNATLAVHTELRVQARLMDAQGKLLFSEQAAVSVAADGVAKAFSIPEQQQLTFLALTLAEKSGGQVSRNFYWLPARLAQLDWAKGDYFHTPGNPYADMRALAEMPKATVTASARFDRATGRVLVTLANRGGQLAFFLRARAVKPGSDEAIAPVFWDDNYISLPPGERHNLILTFPAGALPPAEIRIDGWNVEEQILRPQ